MRLLSYTIALVVSLVAWNAQAQFLSPGPLAADHKSIDGDDKCANCHISGKRVEQKLCLKCHDDLGKRIRAGKGLHGKTYRRKRCESCHIDHLGRKHQLVRWPGKNRNRFNHNEAGWPLKGAHRKTGCDKCHDKRNSRGHKTYLGLPTKCVSCHEDPHKGDLGNKCQDCHSEVDWKKVNIAEFDHDRTKYPLRGKHRKVKCEECHGKPAKYKGLKFADCDDCHKDPHKGQFRRKKCDSCHVVSGWDSTSGFRRNHPGVRITAGHRKVGCKKCHDKGNLKPPSKGRKCQNCHKPVHLAKFSRNCKQCHASIKWVGLPEKVGRKNHGKTRYPLEGKHKQTKCQSCHPKSKPQKKRFRNLAFKRCDSCHKDTHKGEFKKMNGGECAQCHQVFGFRPTTFGIEMHKKTAFALDGSHVAAPCARCHPGKRPRVSFKVAKKVCVDCHDNPHGDQFAAEMAKGGCAQCHNTTGWNQPNIDHSTWPLTGAHSRAKCESCHSPSKADKKTGSGATYRGVPRECEGCHEDIHAGQFRLSNPVKACKVCHSTEVFTIKAFDHVNEANYPLTGGHKKVGCEKCHRKESLRSGKEIVRYRLGYRACKDCHANPHPN